MSEERSMLLETLILNLASHWLAEETIDEVGSDVDKLRLLKQVRDALNDNPNYRPSQPMRDLYLGVFLRDQWPRGTHSRPAESGEAP